MPTNCRHKEDAEPCSKDDIADLILLNRDESGILLNDNDYPVVWENILPDFSDRWQLLNHLINEGNNDAQLHLSGNITDAEFMQRQSIIEKKIFDAGIKLDEYLMAFKNS